MHELISQKTVSEEKKKKITSRTKQLRKYIHNQLACFQHHPWPDRISSKAACYFFTLENLSVSFLPNILAYMIKIEVATFRSGFAMNTTVSHQDTTEAWSRWSVFLSSGLCDQFGTCSHTSWKNTL